MRDTDPLLSEKDEFFINSRSSGVPAAPTPSPTPSPAPTTAPATTTPTTAPVPVPTTSSSDAGGESRASSNDRGDCSTLVQTSTPIGDVAKVNDEPFDNLQAEKELLKAGANPGGPSSNPFGSAVDDSTHCRDNSLVDRFRPSRCFCLEGYHPTDHEEQCRDHAGQVKLQGALYRRWMKARGSNRKMLEDLKSIMSRQQTDMSDLRKAIHVTEIKLEKSEKLEDAIKEILEDGVIQSMADEKYGELGVALKKLQDMIRN